MYFLFKILHHVMACTSLKLYILLVYAELTSITVRSQHTFILFYNFTYYLSI